MSEVYSTPVHDSPEPQEVSVDILAQEELEGMQSQPSPVGDLVQLPIDLDLLYLRVFVVPLKRRDSIQ